MCESFENMNIEDKVYLFYCQLGSGKRFVTTCTSPDKFFENYDSIIAILEQLTSFEKKRLYEFYAPLPSSELLQYTSDEMYNKLVNDFIIRFWYKILDETRKIKSNMKRIEKINSIKSALQQHYDRFTKENLNLIDELLSTELNLDSLPSKPKERVEFDRFTEQSLLNIMKNQTNAVRKHYCYTDLIKFYYKYRNDYPQAAVECMKYCQKDIVSLPDVEETYVNQQIETINRLYGDNEEKRISRIAEIKERGFCATIPAFDKITMLFFYEKDYESAIAYCKMAIEYGQDHDLKYTKRIERFKNKRAAEEKAMFGSVLLHSD